MPAPEPAAERPLSRIQRMGRDVDELGYSVPGMVGRACSGIWQFVGSDQVRNGLILVGLFMAAGIGLEITRRIAAHDALLERMAKSADIQGYATMVALQRAGLMSDKPQAPPQAIDPNKLLAGAATGGAAR